MLRSDAHQRDLELVERAFAWTISTMNQAPSRAGRPPER
jgi:hypothetical protein